MHLKLLSLAITAALLTGCNGDSNSPSIPVKPEQPLIPLEPSIPVEPEQPLIPLEPSIPVKPEQPLIPLEPSSPIVINGLFSFNNSQIFGPTILCNDKPANGFTFDAGSSISCTYAEIELATFSNVGLSPSKQGDVLYQRTLDLMDSDRFSSLSDEQKSNIKDNLNTLFNRFAVLTDKTINLELQSLNLLKFKTFYESDSDLSLAPSEFSQLLQQIADENIQPDSQPSTHKPDIKPVVTPGASDDLNSGFVSANAEDNYHYKPQQPILAEAVLVDSNGLPVQGVEYYSLSSRGITDSTGKFSFNWGDTVSFGIDTFELGEVRGNKNSFYLTELAPETQGRNIERLLKRYSTGEDHIVVAPTVKNIFSQYPNVINDIIQLSLSESTKINNGTEIVEVKGEFEQQFESGLAHQVDQAIELNLMDNLTRFYNVSTSSSDRVMNASTGDAKHVLNQVKNLWGINQGWLPVHKFHVFHDSTNFYGSTGNARGQAAINISNSAFPVMMARNDNNYWISFGDKAAWDNHGLAFITESPSIVKPELVGHERATFNLPFITLGKIGLGKVMLMGNARYNSILVCPNGYSWDGSVNAQGVCSKTNDSHDMANFFNNVFKELSAEYSTSAEPITIGTNISTVYFKKGGQTRGHSAKYIIDNKVFNVETVQIANFDINPREMPILILNGFDYIDIKGHYDVPLSADLTKPKLTQEDITALIRYVEQGGSILIMETLDKENTGELGRLLDSAGIAVTRHSVVPNGKQGYPDRPRSLRANPIWVLERYASVKNESGDGYKLPYTISPDGSVVWDYIANNKPDDKPKLEVATWQEKNDKGELITRPAFFEETPDLTQEQITAKQNEILSHFDGYKVCENSGYDYEVNCLERRQGSDIPVTGTMFVPRYTELALGNAVANSMIKAADLGTNIERLYQHELYFRTKAKQGVRLSNTDLNRLYQNMSVWLWNSIDYRVDNDVSQDDLGFARFTEFLNCYGDKVPGQTTCSDTLKKSLEDNNMIYKAGNGKYSGWMNPSYPLNYMEKPLTRLMLGRSYFDLDIKADIRQYPGEARSSGGGTSVAVDLSNKTAAWFAGNRQSTGQWAIAQEPMTIAASGNTKPITVIVALADDLTGREKHELGLKRPPRITKTFTLQPGTTETITAPYGGLIYVQGNETGHVTLNFSGTVNAPWFKDNQWVNDLNSPAPIGEIESQSFIYTAPSQNLQAKNYLNGAVDFAEDLDIFSQDLNDFYARDGQDGEGGSNQRATDSSRPNNKHHFVNDIAISIGAAHSGYPVMNSSFNTNSQEIGLQPLTSWLLAHEVGHNAAEAPFAVEGSTEVVNNIFALYMQEKHQGKMKRVEQDIRIAPEFVAQNRTHAWAEADVGMRLVMFAQLKLWAQSEFNIQDWYLDKDVPAFYNAKSSLSGWDLFKLMHRLTRNELDNEMTLIGETNWCQPQSGLTKGDQLMVCASYASQRDLSDFFKDWNPGSQAYFSPNSIAPNYEGGISDSGLQLVRDMKLPKPTTNPLAIDQI
ncbi:SslE/AcfD family lipoprotein zinc metalloprotease [Photobacterium damselae]